MVEQVQHEILEAPITVYNFEVADFHTYYVGDTEVLVYNDCDGTNKSVQMLANKQGYSKVKGEYSHGKSIFFNPKATFDMRYISFDGTSHTGGAWKAASSIANLGNKTTRTGTFNWDLSVRIGD